MKELLYETVKSSGIDPIKIKGSVSAGWEPIGPIVIDEGLQKFYFQSMTKEIKPLVTEKPVGKRGRPRKEV